MRAAAGYVGLQLAFVAVGMALLFALRLVVRVRDVPAAIGAAYLTGTAAVMTVLCALIVLDVGVRLPELAAVSAAIAAASVAVGVTRMRRAAAPAEPVVRTAGPPVETWLARAATAALGLYAAIGTSAFAKVPTIGDDWAFWSYKGTLLYDYGGRLLPDVWLGRFPHPPHLDYPVLQPLLESLTFRAMGGLHLREWHITLWLLFVAFVWTVWFLLRSRGASSRVLIAPLAVLLLSPSAAYFTSIGYADVAVAGFAGAGALAVGLWLERGRIEHALLGAVLLAAAANVKNEGQAAALAVLVAAALVLLVARDGRWRGWLIAAGITAAGAAPWILWRSHHGIRNDDVPPLSKTLDWDYLSDRFDRLGNAVGKLFSQLANQGGWLWVVPCFLALAIACFATRTARRTAAFYLAATTVMMVSLYWAYWTGRYPMPDWLMVSADRVVAGVVFTAGVGVVHLVALLLSRRSLPESS